MRLGFLGTSHGGRLPRIFYRGRLLSVIIQDKLCVGASVAMQGKLAWEVHVFHQGILEGELLEVDFLEEEGPVWGATASVVRIVIVSDD